MTDVRTVAVDSLHSADDNPRRALGDLTELAASIAGDVGLLEPPVVSPNGDGYTIVAGHRRVAAAKKAGLTEIPVIVRELDERGRLEAMLVENLQRTDLAPLEEAAGYRRLTELGLSQRELAKRVGRSQAHVSKRIALLELPDVAKTALDSGRITLEDAPELKRLAEYPDRVEKAIAAAANPYTSIVRAVDEQLREQKAEDVKRKAKERAKSEGIKLVGYPNYGGKARVLGKELSYNTIPFTKAQHKKEPCHAAALSNSYIDRAFVYVCTDVERHNAKGESKLKLPKNVDVRKTTSPATRESAEDRARREAEEKEFELLVAKRREWLTKLVQNIRGRKISKEEITTAIASAFVLTYNDGDAYGDAAVALGIQPTMSYGMTPKIEKYVAESPAHMTKLAFAAALFAGNAALDEQHADPSGYTWFIEFLERHGYELSDFERNSSKR